MTKQWNRRELLAQLAGASAGMRLPQGSTIASGAERIELRRMKKEDFHSLA